MLKLRSPIPQTIKDETKLNNFYKSYNLVPYIGNSKASGHSFLTLLNHCYDLSPSHATCIDDISFWSFEGTLNATEGVPNEQNTQIVPENTFNDFFDTFFEITGFDDAAINELTAQLFKSLKKTGNAYLYYKEYRFGGAKKVRLEFLDPQQVMYIKTQIGEPKSIAISESFFEGAFLETPQVIRVFPDVRQSKNTVETVFHFKNQRDHSRWYGRPDSLQALIPVLIEIAFNEKSLKIGKTDFVSKAIMFLQDYNPNTKVAGLGSDEPKIADAIKELRGKTTNKGTYDEIEGFGVFTYPHGVEKPIFHNVDINRDTQYDKFSYENASGFIYAAHHWGKTISGLTQPRTGIGGNVLLDEIIMRNRGTIIPNQIRWSRYWNRVTTFMFREIAPEFSNNYFLFENKMIGLIEDLKQSNAKNTTNTEGINNPSEDQQQ